MAATAVQMQPQTHCGVLHGALCHRERAPNTMQAACMGARFSLQQPAGSCAQPQLRGNLLHGISLVSLIKE